MKEGFEAVGRGNHNLLVIYSVLPFLGWPWEAIGEEWKERERGPWKGTKEVDLKVGKAPRELLFFGAN